MNTNKTESIRFFWNGIKVNGGKLIRCYYFTDSRSDSVTIGARDYDHLPRDLFTVKTASALKPALTDHKTGYLGAAAPGKATAPQKSKIYTFKHNFRRFYHE